MWAKVILEDFLYFSFGIAVILGTLFWLVRNIKLNAKRKVKPLRIWIESVVILIVGLFILSMVFLVYALFNIT